MIHCIGFDVECLKNFFSITFISINDYLKIFADCKKNNKPVPLIQCLSVKEIKNRLDSVQCWQFYISDENDSQLLPLIDFINKTVPTIENNVVKDRFDLYGYNSYNYDNLMVAALLVNYNRVTTTKELLRKLYDTSQSIINNQDDKSFIRNNFYLNSLTKYKLPFQGIDVMRIFHLDKANTIVDKEGNRIGVPKGLKQTSINLQWYELLEYEMPPINEEEYTKYYNEGNTKGLRLEEVRRRIDKWNRCILSEYIPDMMHYNKNDVFIVCEIVRLYSDEIKSRYSISKVYGVNVLNSSRSNMADILFTNFYSKFSGLEPYEWQGKKTERTAMAFKKVIFPFIQFKTPELQKALEEMKQVIIYRTSKDAFSKEIKIGNNIYTVATGGLHSQDNPVELWSSNRGQWTSSLTGEFEESSDDYTYIHADITSMYPSIIAAHKVAPEHLNISAFCNCVNWMRETRIKVKHWNEEYYEGIPKDILALVLKIVINSIYGKLGFQYGDIYDRLAVLKVTINGQLMILMLVEELELNGIQVFSANTDGIVVKLYNKDIDKYNSIKNNWEEITKLKFDTDYYECLISRDINNYLSQFRINKKGVHKLELETKGALNPLMYANDLTKGYDMPIVAEAVKEFFLNDVPVMKTLQNATNILDFCKTQNVGRQFHVEVEYLKNGNVIRENYQRYVRYYVSNNGVVIYKVNNDVENSNAVDKANLAAGQVVTIINTLDDKDISLRDINYKYYYLECMKIINPIKLGISPKGKGKTKIKKQFGAFNKLF